MTLMTVKYLGDLHTECTHLASGATIVTDAPVDNQGRGEAFSPTDLCALSLAACAVTTMGMYGQAHDCDIAGASVSVEKVMAANPRRGREHRVHHAGQGVHRQTKAGAGTRRPGLPGAPLSASGHGEEYDLHLGQVGR